MTVLLPKSSPIRVGQRIYSGLYSRGFGTVVAIHGEQAPASVQALVLGARGGRAEFDIVFDCGASSLQLPESILRGVQWEVFDEVVGQEAVAGAIVKGQLFKAEAAAKADEAARVFADAMEALRNSPNHKHLTPLADKYDGKLTGKNIRAHLKKHFPKVRFSVRTERGSVRVRWSDGPTDSQVDQVANAFKGGSFDGMTDCYSYERSPFTDLFGSFTYVSTTREYSDAMIEFAIGATFDKYADNLQGVERPTVAAFRSGALWNVRVSVPGQWRIDDLQTLIYRVASYIVGGPAGFVLPYEAAE